jgi:hypothetical protein
VVVGLVVGVAASLTGASICGAGEEGLRCHELSRTLSIRVGVVAGLMAILMVLVVAGLLKMLSQDDHDRAERAMEAYRASRSGGTSD